MKTLAIIQARLGSRRLERKVALRLGNDSLLGHIARRVLACRRVDKVIVATTDTPEDRELLALVPDGVRVFFGSERDVLGRFIAALDEHPAEGVVRVCADNPFIDPQLIDELVAAAESRSECDYLSHRLADGRPAILTPIGVFAEWCRTDALRRAGRETRDSADREHVTRCLYSQPERFRAGWLAAPPELNRSDLRLTVDFADDWIHAQEIYSSLGPNHLGWRQIVEHVEACPQLRRSMRQLNDANPKSTPLRAA